MDAFFALAAKFRKAHGAAGERLKEAVMHDVMIVTAAFFGTTTTIVGGVWIATRTSKRARYAIFGA